MSKVIPLYSDNVAFEQACDWVAKLAKGEMSAEEQDVLHRWLAESPAHEEMLLKASDTWDELGELSELSSLFPIDKAEETLDTSESERYGFWQGISGVPAYATAAVVVVVIAIWGYWGAGGESIGEINVAGKISTSVGGYKTASLIDGTRVTLNTDTQISATYDNEDTQRRVLLERGEAHFDVASDPSRPFIVVVGDKQFKAVGTAFNIQMMVGGVELTVTEGIVEVSFPHSSTPGAGSQEQGYDVQQVTAGHIVMVGDEFAEMGDVSKRVIDKNLSWQQGKLQFDGESLEQVVNELSRYSTYEFVFTDESAGNIPVGGYFDIGNVDELLSVLDEGFGVDVRVEDSNRVYISLAQ